MRNYKLTQQADKDLEIIWEYTFLNWGENQAVKYLNNLEQNFFKICENPSVGYRRFDLVGSPLSSHCGRHVTFYRVLNNDIEIIRILHDSMDFPRYLK